jgi:hypothetical protein
MVAQAVIEEIALPIHAMFSGNELFPVFDGCCHSGFPRERNNRVQVIGHKQAQATMPDEPLVIESHSGKHAVAGVCATQLVFPRRYAVDGDKEPTALGHPLWNCVRQFFTHGQLHARERIETLTTQQQKGRAGSPLHAVPFAIHTAARTE